jgi:hypothetical protein
VSALSARTFIRWSGFALVLWAVHLLVRDYVFAFTHGTTEAAMGLKVLGLTSSQYSVLWTAFAPLGVIGFAGVYVQLSPRLSRIGKAGFVVALLGLALWFMSAVMQFWILDVDRYFHSPLVYGGWLLSLVSLLVLTAGLGLAGVDVRRANALPRARSLILVIGITLLPTIVLQVYLVQHSDGSLLSKMLYGSLSVPCDLCWLWLGSLMALQANQERTESRQSRGPGDRRPG